MIADVLYRVGKELFDGILKLDEKRIQRKDKIADYFSHLGQIIEDTSALLKKGQYPHGQCAELQMHAQQMVATIGDLIGNEKAQDYQNQVMQVWQIEKLFGELQTLTSDEKTDKFKTLDAAAGYFRGIAAHLRISR